MKLLFIAGTQSIRCLHHSLSFLIFGFLSVDRLCFHSGLSRIHRPFRVLWSKCLECLNRFLEFFSCFGFWNDTFCDHVFIWSYFLFVFLYSLLHPLFRDKVDTCLCIRFNFEVVIGSGHRMIPSQALHVIYRIHFRATIDKKHFSSLSHTLPLVLNGYKTFPSLLLLSLKLLSAAYV